MIPSKTGIASVASRALTLVALLVLTQLCWRHLQSDPPPRHLIRQTVTLDSSAWPEPFEPIMKGDGTGNLFLEMKPGSHSGEFVEKVSSYYYFRANYLLYPRRLFCAPESRIINKGSDLIRVNFQPDPAWLQQHHVAATWVFDFDKSILAPYPLAGGGP